MQSVGAQVTPETDKAPRVPGQEDDTEGLLASTGKAAAEVGPRPAGQSGVR